MYSLTFAYKSKSKKITIPKNIDSENFIQLISQSFNLREKLIGITNNKGQLIDLNSVLANNKVDKYEKELLFLITTEDINQQDHMSFVFVASEQHDKPLQMNNKKNKKQKTYHDEIQIKLPQKLEGYYQGVIGDLEIFQQLFLAQNQVTIIFCFIKQKPRNVQYPYYLFHTSKNSAIIYMGQTRICQFFIENMQQLPKQIQSFIRSMLGGSKPLSGSQLHQDQQQPQPQHQHQQLANQQLQQLDQIQKAFLKNKPKVQSKKQSKRQSKRQSQKQKQKQKQKTININNIKQQSNVHNNPNNTNDIHREIFFNADVNAEDKLDLNDMNGINDINDINLNALIHGQQPHEIDDNESPQQHPLQEQSQQNDDNQQYPQYQQQSELIEDDQQVKQQEIKTSLLENLLKLKDDQQITELQFYKMKSQLLQNLSDFMRKYQMGTRKGRRQQKMTSNNNNNNNFNSNDNENRINRNRKQNDIQQKLQFDLRNKKNSSSSNNFAKKTKKTNTQNYKPRPQQRQNEKRAIQRERQHQRQNKNRYSRQKYQHQQEEMREIREPTPSQMPRSTIYSRDQRRVKKYQIPIIVRKYNNVIEKISTSYPLSYEQEQSINLILELELKGLISQKQSGIYKSCILQQDKEVSSLFLDYFDGLIDQIELVSKIKKIKKLQSNQGNSTSMNEKEQKNQSNMHNMRLLIKYSKESNYQMLRNLLIQKNQHVISALQRFRKQKNGQKLKHKLEKIAQFYRQKIQLDDDVLE